MSQRPSALVTLLVVLIAIGTCAVAVATFAPVLLGGLGAWPTIAGGTILAAVALSALWVIQKRRDRMLR